MKKLLIAEAVLKLISIVVGVICLILLVKTMSGLPGDMFPWGGKTDDVVDTSVTYDEIYNAYESNELVADELYKGNRYRITATVHRINTDGIFNVTGGATINMRVAVGDNVVSIIGEFEKDQEEALKLIVVGDTITFEGECGSARAWIECEIVE